MEESSESKPLKIWPWRLLWGALAFLTLAVTVVALNPEWRVRSRAWFFGDQKELLATVTGDLLGDGTAFKILKFATVGGLIIEVLAPKADPQQPFTFVDRIFIPDRHDGYFSLKAQATRLAIVDVDGDGIPEIIAPSFDEKLVAHLNTLRLDPDTRRLELIRPPSHP